MKISNERERKKKKKKREFREIEMKEKKKIINQREKLYFSRKNYLLCIITDEVIIIRRDKTRITRINTSCERTLYLLVIHYIVCTMFLQ